MEIEVYLVNVLIPRLVEPCYAAVGHNKCDNGRRLCGSHPHDGQDI